MLGQTIQVRIVLAALGGELSCFHDNFAKVQSDVRPQSRKLALSTVEETNVALAASTLISSEASLSFLENRAVDKQTAFTEG